MYQPVPSVTFPLGQTPGKFSKTVKSQKVFLPNPQGMGFHENPTSNKLYTLSPFSRPQSLIYLLNIYKPTRIT